MCVGNYSMRKAADIKEGDRLIDKGSDQPREVTATTGPGADVTLTLGGDTRTLPAAALLPVWRRP